MQKIKKPPELTGGFFQALLVITLSFHLKCYCRVFPLQIYLVFICCDCECLNKRRSLSCFYSYAQNILILKFFIFRTPLTGFLIKNEIPFRFVWNCPQ